MNNSEFNDIKLTDANLSEPDGRLKAKFIEYLSQGFPIDGILIHGMYEQKRQYRAWAEKLPIFDFPADWKIQIIPPFCNALIRFIVHKQDARVSIYFDSDNQLGYMNKPYWEAYPIYYGDDVDTFRCYLGEEDELLKVIEKSLNDQINNPKKIKEINEKIHINIKETLKSFKDKEVNDEK